MWLGSYTSRWYNKMYPYFITHFQLCPPLHSTNPQISQSSLLCHNHHACYWADLLLAGLSFVDCPLPPPPIFCLAHIHTVYDNLRHLLIMLVSPTTLFLKLGALKMKWDVWPSTFGRIPSPPATHLSWFTASFPLLLTLPWPFSMAPYPSPFIPAHSSRHRLTKAFGCMG